MRTKNSSNSNLKGNLDRDILYTGNVVDMNGYDFSEKGVEFYDDMNSNINGTLEDLLSMSYGKIGDIVIRNDMTSPEGVKQQTLLGVSIVGGNVAPNKLEMLFFGKKLMFNSGETLVSIKQKMLKVFTDYIDEGLYFSSAVLDDNNEIVITYKDTRVHNTEDLIPYPHFFAFEYTNLVESSVGHGKWEFIGTKEEKLGVDTITMNYFKRIG